MLAGDGGVTAWMVNYKHPAVHGGEGLLQTPLQAASARAYISRTSQKERGSVEWGRPVILVLEKRGCMRVPG